MESSFETSELFATAQKMQIDNNYVEAISMYESIIELDRENVSIYVRLGQLYNSLHLSDHAKRIYERGILLAKSAQNDRAVRHISFLLHEVE